VLVAPTGRVVYCSNWRNGATHDKRHWNESGVVDVLKAAYPSHTEQFKFALGGDKAYPMLEKPYPEWLNVVTMTADEEVENARDGVDYSRDPNIAPHRAVVERTIGAIKKWRVLKNIHLISRLDFIELDLLLITLCALTNYQQLERGGATW
jgi:hypothetical protein